MTDDTLWVPPTTRRGFIKRAGGAAAALSIPGLLAACGSTTPVGAQLRLELRLGKLRRLERRRPHRPRRPAPGPARRSR